MIPGSARPLDRPPSIDTCDPTELERYLKMTFGVRKMDLLGRRERFRARVNRLMLGPIDIAYSKFNAATQLACPADDIVRLQFSLGGSAEARIGTTRLHVAGDKACIIPAYVELDQRFGDFFERVIIRVSERALRRKLEALLGMNVSAPVQFEFTDDIGHPNIQMLRQLSVGLFLNADTYIPDTSPAVQLELGQTWMVALLFGAAHNYSRLLNAVPADANKRQIRQAVGFIEFNWNKPLLVEDIAAAVNVSARSLFNAFKRTMSVSPMAYIRTIRLRKANEMLLSASRETSVADVAAACGFHNAGHFAKDYRETFGELPSTTLSRTRTLISLSKRRRI